MEINDKKVDETSEEPQDENEMNVLNTTKSRKKLKIIDSDSENEGDSSDKIDVQDNSNNADISQCISESTKIKRLKRIAIVDSDSEEENVNPINSKESKKNGMVNDSDLGESIEEEEITAHNKSFPDEETAVEAVIYVTNDKGELIQETPKVNIMKSLSALCDSESSEDESEENIIQETFLEEPRIRPIVYKNVKKKKKDDKPKMTVQEAAKQRIEITSESQRMLRETNISLPYHKPKSYTIKEFLEKRSKLPSALPIIPKAPPSVAIKMTKEQLQEVTKKLDERIKEVEEFYKSESDEDEKEDDPSEDIKDWLFALVDSAIDTVESKLNEMKIQEDTCRDLSLEESGSKSANNSKEQDSMEYDFNLDDVNESDVQKKSKIFELLKDKLNIQPKLSGRNDEIIDLEEGVTKPSGVKKLVEKFFRNTVQKVLHKHKVELNVIEVCSGGEIVKETVSMNVDEEEEPSLVETPGAKLQKLREELQIQMAQKRLELWKQKQEQGDILIVERKEKTEKSGAEKDILDDEDEEYEMTESESEDTDDEEEEYEIVEEKSKPKSAFLDEEACEDEEIEEDEEMEFEVNDEHLEDADEEPEKGETQTSKKKVLKRIIKPFTEDSDEDDSTQDSGSTKIIKYFTTDEDDFIPPNLPRVGKTPQRTQVEKNKSEFDFLTPVSYLTSLQNLNSDSKFLRDSSNSAIIPLTNSSPSNDLSSQSSVQKKLFSNNSESSQNDVEDLAQLCSGVFPETQPQSMEEKTSKEDLPNTQDLLNVCSGGFPTLNSTNSNNEKPKELEEQSAEIPPSTQELLNVCSGDFSTFVNSHSENTNQEASTKALVRIETNAEKEIKNLDEEHDQIISQLLDEDELERFKKKFESPINVPIRKTAILEDVEEVNATGLINSDEENEELEIKTKIMKKQKKLVFSDDEGEENNEHPEDSEPSGDSEEEEANMENDERIDLHDSDDEEQQLENEIIAQESSKYKLNDFLEKEAELSESEWGSADEDEKGLDDLEFEEGDTDKVNEKKIRQELERIHMRQILDEDNREVKLLQELLLEDGELHGTGRKRQFRWKTLDSEDNGEFEKKDDDDIFLDEEESEEQWRKMRHKREMFLKKKLTTEDDDSILVDSQILKVGQQIAKNKTVTSQNNTLNNKTEETKNFFSSSNKRGSFLSRSDQVLQRLAEYNKVTTSIGNSIAKKSKAFVFQTVDTSETVVIKENNNKRKATELTPNVIKKLRLADLSPAPGKKQKNSRAKKLFGNW